MNSGNVIDFAQAREARADPHLYGRRLGRIWRPQVTAREITPIRALMRNPADWDAAVDATSDLVVAHVTRGVPGVPMLFDDAQGGEALHHMLEGVMWALTEPELTGEGRRDDI